MNLETRFFNKVKQDKLVRNEKRVVVAVSGGVDSMVLLDLLEKTLPSNTEIIIAHVNHRLRAASEKEERFLKDYANRHHLKIEVAHWKHGKINHGMEEKARNFRYDFFRKVMDKYQSHVLFTAHQRDEQAETVLMKLIRSGNLTEISGMDEDRVFNGGHLLRPLLDCSKADIVKYGQEKQVKWFTDQTNFENETERNRIRNVVIPELKKENPKAEGHISAFSYNLKQLEKETDSLARLFLSQLNLETNDSEVKVTLPNRIYVDNQLKPIIRSLFQKMQPTVSLTDKQQHEISKLIQNQQKPTGKLNLAHGYLFQKSYQQIGFLKKMKQTETRRKSANSFMLRLNQWYEADNGNRFGVFLPELISEKNVTRFSPFYLGNGDLPLFVSRVKKTDSIKLAQGHQTMARLAINEKLSSTQRDNLQVVETNDHKILAAIGYKESNGKRVPGANKQKYVFCVK